MGQLPDAHAPTVSLCLIVRDEAELLPRFLRQAAGLWDDLCVVDTGSRDATPAILRAAGARVIERAWDDDFSAARNAGLAGATGDWIVVLDADEMVSAEAVAEIRALTRDATAGAATVRMVNLMPHGRARETHLLRVFRNHPSLRFKHRIHEEVASAVASYLALHGLGMRQVDGAVEHLGYERVRAAARGKKSRDTALLRRAIAEDARDFYSWFKLLELARFWSDAALFAEVGPACHAALGAAGPLALAGAPWGGDLVALLAHALHAGHPSAELAFLQRHAPGVAASAAFSLRLGECQERAGLSDHAAASFRACLALDATTADGELATVRPLMGLARLALARPQGLEDAWALTNQALACNPRDPEALASATAICQLAGGAALLQQFVHDYTARHGTTVELRQAIEAGAGTRAGARSVG